MKKLFVSVPMKGRTKADIDKSIETLKKIAEIYEGEELELIDSYVADEPPVDTKQAVWYLGQSIMKLSEADVFIGVEEAWDWSGCLVERDVAYRYGIQAYTVPARFVIPNYDALLRANSEAVCVKEANV